MFRVKWTEELGNAQAQEKLMAQVAKRLKADKLVLSHTDAEGFQYFVSGKQQKAPASVASCAGMR